MTGHEGLICCVQESQGVTVLIELQRAGRLVRGWWPALLAGCVGAALLAYLVTRLLFPQQYQATSIVAMAPTAQSPNGIYLPLLSAAADSQLVSTARTASAAIAALPQPIQAHVGVQKLTTSITGVSSVDGQLLFVSVRWTDPALAARLADATARAFISQELQRLILRHKIIHQGLQREQTGITARIRATSGGGTPQTWLQSQYADTLSKLYQQDTDTGIELSLQRDSLQLMQSALGQKPAKVGPKALVNAVLGGALGLLIVLVYALVVDRDLNRQEEPGRRPSLVVSQERDTV